MKLVSAVITTRNRVGLLARAVASVRNQTYANVELIVVDDASTDGTGEYCRGQAFKYIAIPAERHGGNFARNAGIREAAGEYVAFLDDDDYWLPDKIKKQVELIEAGDHELVYCGRRIEFVGRSGSRYEDRFARLPRGGDSGRSILTGICTTSSGILASRKALLDIGLFDEKLKFWQEYDLLIRLAQRKSFGCAAEPLFVYRVDVRDRARLTNKYFEWKQSVVYVREKHRHLYERLNRRGRLAARALVWKDGAKRCENSGLYLRFLVLGSLYAVGSLAVRAADIFSGDDAR